MQRIATLMMVKEGRREKYREEHRSVWPDVLDGITRVGIRNYSIFMIGRELYSYFEVEDLDKAMSDLAADPINQEWQEYMAPLMKIGAGIKGRSTTYLKEVFHTEGYCESSTSIQRVAMLMMIKKEMEKKYCEAHRNVWPEVLESIKKAKIRNYSTFIIGRQSFTYFEVKDLGAAMEMISADPSNLKWQEYMVPIMETGFNVKECSTPYLEEVFHID